MQKKHWLFAAAMICLLAQANFGQEKEFVYDGVRRSYTVYEPTLDPNPTGYPLIVGLHGAGSTGNQFLATAFLVQKALQEKFIVASPNSLKYGYVEWWNAGDGYESITNGTDDLGFISALIDTMLVNYPVDPTRVYAMGFSNGAMMAYRVAAELSHRIAAIGTVSGQMVLETCEPEYPMPIIHFHGLCDSTANYEGKGDSIIVLPPVDSVIATWREINHCNPEPDTLLNENGILGRQWNSATGKSDVILYTIAEGEHEWPRPANLGISATDLIWDFLELHTRDTATEISAPPSRPVPAEFELRQNFPNPFNPATQLRYRLAKSDYIIIKVFNLAGQEIEVLVDEFQKAGAYEISWQPRNLSGGIYFCRLESMDFSETRKIIYQK